jgi:hypothetical protein
VKLVNVARGGKSRIRVPLDYAVSGFSLFRTSERRRIMISKTDLLSHACHPETKQAPELKNLCGEEAVQAVDFARNACATAVCLNSCAMNYFRHIFWFPLGLEYWFEGQNQAFATWMDLGTHWLNLLRAKSPEVEATAAEKIEAELEPKIEAEVEAKLERELEETLERELEEEKLEREYEEQRLEREIEEMEHGIDVAVEAFEEGILA